MISIIVCSRDDHYYSQLEENILKTIGCAYELVKIDNKQNDYNIFEAYNEGVKKSKGEILCFCHEDILYHTHDWGLKVKEHFKNEEVGLIGIIGGTALPKVPSPWWNNELLNTHLVNAIQHWRKGVVPEKHYRKLLENRENVSRDFHSPNGRNLEPAVAVDGLWFCIRKELFDHISFDELTYPGFHCYDLDISLQSLQHKKNAVVFDILIEHFSEGSINEAWFRASLAFNRKWKDLLPVFSTPRDQEGLADYVEYELRNLLTFAYWMQSADFSDKEIRKILNYYLPYFKSLPKLPEQYYLLYFWALLGYNRSKYPIKLRKIFKSLLN